MDRTVAGHDLAAAGREWLTAEVRDVLTIAGSVNSRDARGGTSPVRVADQLEKLRDTADQLRARLRR